MPRAVIPDGRIVRSSPAGLRESYARWLHGRATAC